MILEKTEELTQGSMFTKKHTKFWRERKINWERDYLLADGALNHPHRRMIIRRLSELRPGFGSILEVGMGAGANLVLVKKQWPAVEIGGTDINRDAVLTAGKYLKDIKYCDVGDPRHIMMSDKSIDVVMSDACLIYMGRWQIKKALQEMARVAKLNLLLCELHSEKRVRHSRYNIHNYVKLLEDLDCYNIELEKIPKQVWPGTPWEQWGYIITCKTS